MLNIQKLLTAPKNKDAGRYKYRSAEDLYENIKKIIDAPLQVSTEVIEIAGRILIKANAKYKDFSSSAFCEVENAPKIMSIGQAYGAATSYAIKYAICMLFCVDNGEDLDIPEEKKSIESKNGKTSANEGVGPFKRIILKKLTEAGVTDKEDMVDFYQKNCPNDSNLNYVIQHFDSLLSEWKKEKGLVESPIETD